MALLKMRSSNRVWLIRCPSGQVLKSSVPALIYMKALLWHQEKRVLLGLLPVAGVWEQCC